MNTIEVHLTAWAKNAAPAQRRAGPTLDDLGGAAAVTAEAPRLASGPLLPFLVQALAHHLADHVDLDDVPAVRDAVLDALRTHTNHAAYAGVTDALAAAPALARALGPALPRALRARLRAAPDTDDLAVALIGAEAADCLVQLTLAGVTTPAQVLGALDEATEDPAALPLEVAVRLPRLLGVLHARHPDAGLDNALERFLPFDHTHLDAAFELALDDLRAALEHHDYTAMAQHLRRARTSFAALTTRDPDRLDADLYRAALDAVLGLADPDARQRVPQAAAELRTALHRYTSWRHRTATPGWAAMRTASITAWAELAALLAEAAPLLDAEDPWYEGGPAVLPVLLRAYTTHNSVSVTTDASPADAARVMVAPIVEDAFLTNANRVRILLHALDHDDTYRDDPTAQQLRAALTRPPAPTTQPNPRPDGGSGGGQGKARRWHRVAEAFGPQDFMALADAFSEDVLDGLELRLRSSEDSSAAASNPKYDRLITRLVRELSASDDWVPGIADTFMALLEATVRFAYLCYDVGRKMGGSYTEYLRLRDKDGKKQKVDEELFHQHYAEYVSTIALFQVVDYEVINRGGGRTDVEFSFSGVRLNVECKIEEEDATQAGLRTYVAQAAEYQNTNAGFAVLLALDKTVGAEGAVNLFESVWIEQVRRPGEAEPCRVVIIRVPGGRENPNRLRPA